MAVKKTTVKNFYRALAASAYVAGASAAGLALGGPPGAAAAAAAATAQLATPLGVTAVELAAEAGTEYAVGSEKMATGGLVMEPTFAMLGEAGPEMIFPSGAGRVINAQRTAAMQEAMLRRSASGVGVGGGSAIIAPTTVANTNSTNITHTTTSLINPDLVVSTVNKAA